MKKSIILLLALFLISIYSVNLTSDSNSDSHVSVLETSSSKMDEGDAAAIMQKLPLIFIENKGQIDERVHLQLKLSGMDAYFTSQEIVYQLIHREEKKTRLDNIRMTFVGMNEEVKVKGEAESEGKINYFKGNNPERWVSGARTYKKITYRELYPDIDLFVYGERGKLKYEYRVRPGGDVEDIQIKYEGIEKVKVSEQGELVGVLKGGEFKEGFPVSYQRINGENVEVESSYTILEDNTIGFKVEEYEKGKELIIDPELSFSSYLGGGNSDYGGGIAVDGSGNVFVTGQTHSTDFPTTSGSYDLSHNDGLDVFITKLNSAGSALIYSTYLGGSGFEYGNGIVIDGDGCAYATGRTLSTDFPTTPGAYDTSHNGAYDVFVTKLNSTGSALVYSTFLGGGSEDKGHGIAIDGIGNAYITGKVSSANFPTTPGSYDTSYNDFGDLFISKLNSSGSALVYSTYLGGSETDWAYGIAIDGSGNAYITGKTESTDFPTTPDAFDTSFNGGNEDAIVTKLNSMGSDLSYSTFLGGSAAFFEYGTGITTDGTGYVYVIGRTESTDFPTTPGAYNTSNSGGRDVFIAKFDLNPDPDMNVKLLGTSISDGEVFNFGTVTLKKVVKGDLPFTIQNLGAGPLLLTGNPDKVSLSGMAAGYFYVSQQPSSPVAAGSSTVFKIKCVFDSVPPWIPPGWSKNISLTITIPNNDPDEDPYNFTLSGNVKK